MQQCASFDGRMLQQRHLRVHVIPAGDDILNCCWMYALTWLPLLLLLLLLLPLLLLLSPCFARWCAACRCWRASPWQQQHHNEPMR
jgi:hypothetical protein